MLKNLTTPMWFKTSALCNSRILLNRNSATIWNSRLDTRDMQKLESFYVDLDSGFSIGFKNDNFLFFSNFLNGTWHPLITVQNLYKWNTCYTRSQRFDWYALYKVRITGNIFGLSFHRSPLCFVYWRPTYPIWLIKFNTRSVTIQSMKTCN